MLQIGKRYPTKPKSINENTQNVNEFLDLNVNSNNGKSDVNSEVHTNVDGRIIDSNVDKSSGEEKQLKIENPEIKISKDKKDKSIKESNMDKMLKDEKLKKEEDIKNKEKQKQKQLEENILYGSYQNKNNNYNKVSLYEVMNDIQESTKQELKYIALTEMYYNSLVLDDAYLVENSKVIKERSMNFFKLLIENKLLSFDITTESVSKINSVIEKHAKIITERYMVEDMKKVDKFNVTIKEAYNDFVNDIIAETAYITEIVQNKVTQAIIRENEYVTKLEALKESKPLAYESMINKHHKSPATLIEGITKKLLENHLINSVERPDMESIFGESIQYYTMLESVNTLKMIKMNPNDFNSFLRSDFFYYENLHLVKR